MKFRSLLFAAAVVIGLPTGSAMAGDCTGFVVGVAPISEYDRYSGAGFLAVRTGPGSGYEKIGEVYLGDEISVWSRRGNWYRIACMSGRCTNPLWGNPSPQGWAHGRYLNVDGVCP